MDAMAEMKGEHIHLTLTLGQVDALHKAGIMALDIKGLSADDRHDLEAALQTMDEAVNI